MMTMRAKMYVLSITRMSSGGAAVTQETLKLHCVGKSGSYGSDGLDEDNTFAKFSPSGTLELTVANPALLGKFKPGQKFYLDFSEVPADPAKIETAKAPA